MPDTGSGGYVEKPDTTEATEDDMSKFCFKAVTSAAVQRVMETHFWRGVCNEPDKFVSISIGEIMRMLEHVSA